MQIRSRLLIAASVMATTLSLKADTLTSFNLSGVLTDAGTVTGTVVIDTTTGVFETANFTATGYSTSTTFSGLPYYQGIDSPTPDAYAQYSVDGTAPTSPGQFFFSVEIGQGSAVGYAGGSITGGEGQLNAVANSNQFDPLVSGTLTAVPTVAQTPEPTTLVLVGTSLAGFVQVFRRRRT